MRSQPLTLLELATPAICRAEIINGEFVLQNAIIVNLVSKMEWKITEFTSGCGDAVIHGGIVRGAIGLGYRCRRHQGYSLENDDEDNYLNEHRNEEVG